MMKNLAKSKPKLAQFILGILFSFSAYGNDVTLDLKDIQVPKSHPSLFFQLSSLPAIRERSLSLPWLSEVRTEMRKQAERYMAVQTEPYQLITQYNGIGTAGRAVQNFVGTLAFSGYLFEEEKYLLKAKEILLAVVRQTEPNNRAHWRGHLQNGDATQALVLGYDLLYPKLNQDEKNEILDEIYKAGIELTDPKTAWGADAPGVLSCNHNSVHYGALGLAALALWHKDFEQKETWLSMSYERIDGYLGAFSDDTGYGTEGHHYYAYGLAGTALFSRALHRSGGPNLLRKHTVLAKAADQILWKLLPFEGRMLALNDNNETPSDVSAIMGSLLYNQPYQLWAWLESIRGSGKPHLLAGFARSAYTAPFLFLWGDQPVQPLHPKTNPDMPLGHHFESGRVFLRSSWNGQDAAHFSMTSGYDNHRGHDHQDENSVTFYALGEGFLIDPQYRPEKSHAHTTLSVNGAEQIKGGDGRIAKYREDTHGALVRGQAEEAYDFVAALVGMADRKAYFVRGPDPYLIFRDDMQLENDKPAKYTARYITYPNNQIETGDKAATIHGGRNQAKAKLWVFSRDKSLNISEDDLTGEIFFRQRADRRYSDYMKRMVVEVEAINPRLLSILIPYKSEKTLPEIHVDYDHKTRRHFLAVAFKNYTDKFEITEKDILHTRSNRK